MVAGYISQQCLTYMRQSKIVIHINCRPDTDIHIYCLVLLFFSSTAWHILSVKAEVCILEHTCGTINSLSLAQSRKYQLMDLFSNKFTGNIQKFSDLIIKITKCRRDLIDLTAVVELKSKYIFLHKFDKTFKVLLGYCNICLSTTGNVLKLYKRASYTNSNLISMDHEQKIILYFSF